MHSSLKMSKSAITHILKNGQQCDVEVILLKSKSTIRLKTMFYRNFFHYAAPFVAASFQKALVLDLGEYSAIPQNCTFW